MVLAVLKAAKSLSESQVSDDIHGEEVQPVRHIDQGTLCGAALTNKLSDLTDQGICMPADQRVLGAKSIFGEGAAQQSTGTEMEFGIVGGYDVVGLIIWC